MAWTKRIGRGPSGTHDNRGRDVLQGREGLGRDQRPELPDGLDAFFHFSTIEAEGYKAFEQGDQVEFDYEPAQQDSFRFRATRARSL